MRIAYVADVHVANHRRHGGATVAGLNERCRLVVGVLSGALQLALRERCQGFVICGDLVDTSSPEPQVLAAVQQELREAAKAGLAVLLLVGNHDQESTTRGDNALGVLSDWATLVESPGVYHIETTCSSWAPSACRWVEGPAYGACKEGVEVAAMPYHPDPVSSWLELAVQQCCSTPALQDGRMPYRLLAVHMGVADTMTAPWLKDAHDAVQIDVLAALADKHYVHAVFAGNWHDAVSWEDPPPPVYQIGALCPTGWDNPGLDGYGGVMVHDTATGETVRHEIPGPRFISCRYKDGVPAGHDRHKLYVEVVARAGDEYTAAVQTVEGLRRAGAIVGEVAMDSTEAAAMARTAAHVARKASSLDEALDGWLSTVPVPAGVDRGNARTRILRYLQGAR